MASKRRNGRAPIPEPSQTFVEDPERKAAGDEDADDAPKTNGRLEALGGLLDQWCQLQAREDALLEKYIHPIRKEKADVKASAKSDYDIPTEAFNARAALRRIELKEKGDEVLVAINEMFQATPVGKNVDMIAAAERVAAKKAAEAEAAAAAVAEKAARKSKIKEGKEAAL